MKCFPCKHEGLTLSPSTHVKARSSERQLCNPSAAWRVSTPSLGIADGTGEPKSRKDPVSIKQVESLEEDALC